MRAIGHNCSLCWWMCPVHKRQLGNIKSTKRQPNQCHSIAHQQFRQSDFVNLDFPWYPSSWIWVGYTPSVVQPSGAKMHLLGKLGESIWIKNPLLLPLWCCISGYLAILCLHWFIKENSHVFSCWVCIESLSVLDYELLWQGGTKPSHPSSVVY